MIEGTFHKEDRHHKPYFLRKYYIVFYSVHHKCTRVPVSPHPHQHLLFSGFLIAILMSIMWYILYIYVYMYILYIYNIHVYVCITYVLYMYMHILYIYNMHVCMYNICNLYIVYMFTIYNMYVYIVVWISTSLIISEIENIF